MGASRAHSKLHQRGYDLSSCRGFGAECVTFGAPRLGDEAFARRWRASGVHLARLVNRFDLVPRLPPDPEAPRFAWRWRPFQALEGLDQRLQSWLGRVQERLQATSYVHFEPAVELDASRAATALHWATAAVTAAQALSKLRSARSSGGGMAAARRWRAR